MMNKILQCIVILSLSIGLTTPGFAATVIGSGELKNNLRQGAVALPDRYGAETAELILKAGGNAVDAGVATAFTLAVTLPHAGNLGGGGFATIYFAGQPYFLDYREMAPMLANRDMYLDQQGNVIEHETLVGAKAAGVPGTVMGLWEAHKKFGVLKWEDLLQPAIKLALDGIYLSKIQAAWALKARDEWFKEHTNFTTFYGDKLSAGEVIKQPELAATLTRIALQGPDDFYKGKTANLIVEQMNRMQGLITKYDLARYQAKWRDPLTKSWRGKLIHTAAPPSSGGIALIQMLTMKEYLQEQFQHVKLNSTNYVHLLAEIEKRVYSDSGYYLGDPDFSDIPMQRLLSNEYLLEQSNGISVDKKSATSDVSPGFESRQTTHFSILDKEGNGFSNTYTLNWKYGNGVVVEGAGFLLNNTMDDFSAKSGVANAFGVLGGKANEIAAKKRMLSFMTPTIITDNGRIEMIVGTPGGPTIVTSLFQFIINCYDFGLTPQRAASEIRVHHQLFPIDQINMEPYGTLAPHVQSELTDMGYTLTIQDWNLGDIQAITINDGDILVATDPRGEGVAKVFVY